MWDTHDTRDQRSDVMLLLRSVMRRRRPGSCVLYLGNVVRSGGVGEQSLSWMDPLWVWDHDEASLSSSSSSSVVVVVVGSGHPNGDVGRRWRVGNSVLGRLASQDDAVTCLWRPEPHRRRSDQDSRGRQCNLRGFGCRLSGGLRQRLRLDLDEVSLRPMIELQHALSGRLHVARLDELRRRTRPRLRPCGTLRMCGRSAGLRIVLWESAGAVFSSLYVSVAIGAGG